DLSRVMAGAAFVITADLRPGNAAWSRAEAQAAELQAFADRSFGVRARVQLACLPAQSLDEPGKYHFGPVIDRCADDGATELFVLPAAFEFNLWQRTAFGEELSAARRRHPSISIHHDTVDPAHPFLVECQSERILQALGERHAQPGEAGVILVADGRG